LFSLVAFGRAGGSMSDARHLACFMAFIVAPGKQR
jgi:hypothetical protein